MLNIAYAHRSATCLKFKPCGNQSNSFNHDSYSPPPILNYVKERDKNKRFQNWNYIINKKDQNEVLIIQKRS